LERGETFDLVDDAIQRYNRGETMVEIAADYGIASQTLYRWLDVSGVERLLVRRSRRR
jgi:transposase-like protein